MDYGTVEIKRKPNEATLYLKDIASTPEGCNIYHGTFEGLLHLGRARNGKVKKTACQHKGADKCTYVMSWD